MNNLDFITVFIGGITSFFAPCVLPIIPLYLAHLTGNIAKIDKDGQLKYHNLAIFINTSAFIIGLLSVFFLMALGIGKISPLIIKYRDYISIVGGIILMIMALNQLGFIKINFLNQNRQFKINSKNTGFIKSFLMGFFFSFSWSPCIGPILTSVVTYSLVSANPSLSAFYILTYAFGFIIPFVLIAIFGKIILNFFNKNKKTINSIFETASYILIVIAIFMIFTGAKNIYQTYKVNNNIKTNAVSNQDNPKKEKIPALNFKLKDSQGNDVSLDDYKDKYLMMTFIANWCTYCGVQINTNQEYLKENNDLEIIYVMSDEVNSPGVKIEEFAKEKELNKVIKDDGTLFRHYGIYSYPHSVFIGPDSSFIGILPGALQKVEDLKTVFKKVQNHYNQQ